MLLLLVDDHIDAFLCHRNRIIQFPRLSEFQDLRFGLVDQLAQDVRVLFGVAREAAEGTGTGEAPSCERGFTLARRLAERYVGDAEFLPG